MALRLRAARGVAAALLAIVLAGYVSPARSGTLTDMAGRTVRVPDRTRRVVPLGGALRLMVYLRSLDLVAGMENIERRWTAAGRLYGLVTASRARTLPVIGQGGPGHLPDFEKLVSVWPDVIVAMGMADRQVKTVQEKTGIPVVSLKYGKPGVLETGNLRTAIRMLGDLLGRSDRAARLLACMDGLDRDLAARSGGRSGNGSPRVYVGAISFKGAQGITSTEAGHLPLAWAGGANVADAAGQDGHLFIDPEQLLEWDPDVIFIDAGGLDRVKEDYRANPSFYMHLKAVRNGRVHLVMPYNYYHTNIEIAYANAYFMGKVLYPERFADVDAAAKADGIFRSFIGVAAYDALKKQYHGFGRVVFGKDGISVR